MLACILQEGKKRQAKYMMQVRHVVDKIIRKMGESEVRKLVPEEH